MSASLYVYCLVSVSVCVNLNMVPMHICICYSFSLQKILSISTHHMQTCIYNRFVALHTKSTTEKNKKAKNTIFCSALYVFLCASFFGCVFSLLCYGFFPSFFDALRVHFIFSDLVAAAFYETFFSSFFLLPTSNIRQCVRVQQTTAPGLYIKLRLEIAFYIFYFCVYKYDFRVNDLFFCVPLSHIFSHCFSYFSCFALLRISFFWGFFFIHFIQMRCCVFEFAFVCICVSCIL